MAARESLPRDTRTFREYDDKPGSEYYPPDVAELLAKTLRKAESVRLVAQHSGVVLPRPEHHRPEFFQCHFLPARSSNPETVNPSRSSTMVDDGFNLSGPGTAKFEDDSIKTYRTSKPVAPNAEMPILAVKSISVH